MVPTDRYLLRAASLWAQRGFALAQIVAGSVAETQRQCDIQRIQQRKLRQPRGHRRKGARVLVRVAAKHERRCLREVGAGLSQRNYTRAALASRGRRLLELGPATGVRGDNQHISRSGYARKLQNARRVGICSAGCTETKELLASIVGDAT